MVYICQCGVHGGFAGCHRLLAGLKAAIIINTPGTSVVNEFYCVEILIARITLGVHNELACAVKLSWLLL